MLIERKTWLGLSFAGMMTRRHSRSIRPAADHRHARLARRDDDDRRQLSAESAVEIWRLDRPRRRAVEALLAAHRRSAEGRPQRPADHDRRSGLRDLGHVRRRHSHAHHGPHRGNGAALHAVPFDRALLTVTRRRLSPDVTITPSASESSPSRRPATPATTPSSASTTPRSAQS